MQYAVKLFVIPAARVPGGPSEPPIDLVLEASSKDNLRDEARDMVAERGLLLRSLSFGPDSLVVYAEEQP
mgnify:CR=1 FL=1